MFLLPAIDLLDGKPVMLFQGKYDEVTSIGDNPVKMAQAIEKTGVEWLHMVDLDGAREKKVVNGDLIRKVIKNTNLKIELGGGIRTLETIKDYLELGIHRVILGSAALENKELLEEALEKYGERIAVGVDSKNGTVRTNGWLEDSKIPFLDFVHEVKGLGVKTLIVTDIKKDGALEGPNFEMYENLSKISDIQVIASGGVTSLEDIKRLNTLDLYGVIVGKALYSGNIDLDEAVQWVKKNG